MRARQGNPSSAIKEPLWREIHFRLSAGKCEVELGSVDEQASLGGYCGMWCGVHKRSFTWEDLDDNEFLHKLVAFEQHVVARRVLEMLDALREGRVMMRKVLGSTLSDAKQAA